MSVNIANVFAVDKGKEDGGVWVDVSDDIRIRVARMNNTNYAQFVADKMKTRGRRGRTKVSEEESMSMLIEAVANHVLLDWEGVERDGESLPYSPDEGIALLKEHKDFLDFVIDAGNDIDLYRAEAIESDKENLESS